jgi:hypothetical protein
LKYPNGIDGATLRKFTVVRGGKIGFGASDGPQKLFAVPLAFYESDGAGHAARLRVSGACVVEAVEFVD